MKWTACTLALVALAGTSGSVRALDEHDAARAAVATRATLPLEAIVDRVVGSESKILDASIEEHSHGYRYRLKLLEAGHRVREIVVDGRTGAVVSGD